MFELGSELPRGKRILFTILGIVFIIAAWWIAAEAMAVDQVDFKAARLDNPAFAKLDRDSIARVDSIAFANAKVTGKVYPNLPTPAHVVSAFPELLFTEEASESLLSNAKHSVWLNLQGYWWAVLLAIPLGFLIGLIPVVGGMFEKPFDSMRFLPISALTGLFMLWFGLGDQMKVSFLAFGILVYMIPVVIQRIKEVERVHVQTVFTLGATAWQRVKKVYIPAVLSKFIDDLRVLTAISWTYIIIAELLGRGQGLGSLIWVKSRKGETAAIFAILITIVIIGIFQDRIFSWLDKRIFPHKYYKQKVAGLKEIQMGLAIILGVFSLMVLLPVFGLNVSSLVRFAWMIVLASLALVVMGEFKLWKNVKATT